MMNGGGEGLQNGEMYRKRNLYLRDIINLTSLLTLDFMISVFRTRERHRRSLQKNMVSTAFVIIITGLTGREFWSVLSRRYLKAVNRISLLCYAGQTRTGAEHGME